VIGTNRNRKARTRVVPLNAHNRETRIMPALLPIILTASQIVLAADSVPRFDVERICRPAVVASDLPGRETACRRDEQDAHSKLKSDWSQYRAQDRSRCAGFVTVGGAPSYVELLTCLEMAKQAKELREKSPTLGQAPAATRATDGTF
jgi:hypothetical protein